MAGKRTLPPYAIKKTRNHVILTIGGHASGSKNNLSARIASIKRRVVGVQAASKNAFLSGETPSRHRAADLMRAGTRTLTLEDLGYAKDVSISGVSPEFSVYLPNYRTLRRASMNLILRLSDVLNPASTITVLVDDEPLFTQSLKKTGYEPVLSFSIPPSKADFIKITLRGHLFVSDDVCSDMSSGNLWIVASNKSRIILETDGTPDTISDFFRTYDTAVNVVVDAKDGGLEALTLAYKLNRLSGWKHVRLTMSNTPVKKARNIIIGGEGGGLWECGADVPARAAFYCYPNQEHGTCRENVEW